MIQELLALGLKSQPESFTSNDAWLGSCYAVWLDYSLRIRSALFLDQGKLPDMKLHHSEWQRMETGLDIMVSGKVRAVTGSYRAFAEDSEPLRQRHENQIRKVLGWNAVDCEARTSKNREEDISACARYLDVKSKDYATLTFARIILVHENNALLQVRLTLTHVTLLVTGHKERRGLLRPGKQASTASACLGSGSCVLEASRT